MAEILNTDQHHPGTVIGPGGATTPPAPSPADTPPQSTTPETTGPQFATQLDDDAITWTASEFVAHQKSIGWYMVLTGAALVVSGIVYAVTRDIISTFVVLLAAVTFGFLAGRQPRQLQYRLTNSGFDIGQRQYDLANFRSFSVVDEGQFSSIIFMPLKRFAPLTTIYYPPDNEEHIIQILSNALPFEEYRHDVVDRFLHRIRF